MQVPARPGPNETQRLQGRLSSQVSEVDERERIVSISYVGRVEGLGYTLLACLQATQAFCASTDGYRTSVERFRTAQGWHRRTLTVCLLALRTGEQAVDLGLTSGCGEEACEEAGADRAWTTDHLPSDSPFWNDTWSGRAAGSSAGERELCDRPAANLCSGRSESIDGIVHLPARVRTAGDGAGAGACCR